MIFPETEQNRSRYQETWALQTFLLLEYLGIYGGHDGSFLKVQRIHRDLVDAIRMLQMSHDDNTVETFHDSDEDVEDGDENSACEGLEPLDTRWEIFVKKESRKGRVTFVLD